MTDFAALSRVFGGGAEQARASLRFSRLRCGGSEELKKNRGVLEGKSHVPRRLQSMYEWGLTPSTRKNPTRASAAKKWPVYQKF